MPHHEAAEESAPETLRKTLSANIRAFRKALHLTQEALAENADISLSYLADIEHCKTWISDKTLLKLAKALHRKPFEFLQQAPAQEAPQVQQFADIVYEEKKELLKAVAEICDRTLQEMARLE